MPDKETHILLIGGIVSAGDFQPYLQIDIDGHMVQMSMAQARNIARDIEVKCARMEADAMIHRFFAKNDFPRGADDALMIEFREFRSNLDAEEIRRRIQMPDLPYATGAGAASLGQISGEVSEVKTAPVGGKE